MNCSYTVLAPVIAPLDINSTEKHNLHCDDSIHVVDYSTPNIPEPKTGLVFIL